MAITEIEFFGSKPPGYTTARATAQTTTIPGQPPAPVTTVKKKDDNDCPLL
jgi:hypothetical protein